MPPKLIFGGVVFDPAGSIKTVEATRATLQVLQEEGINAIDTAQPGLPRSQSTPSTAGGHIPGQSGRETVIARAEESLRRLGVDCYKVNIFYIHSPDRSADLLDTLAGINELHKRGKFHRFGLSNFLADEVEDVIRLATKHSFVLPTVYQGSYSAVTRRPEKELLPVLRSHGMSFYAYSPIAGGFLAKTREDIAAGQGRWDPRTAFGKFNLALFDNEAMLAGLDAWAHISAKWGISRPHLAYRWIVYHSALDGECGDGVVVGASRVDQIRGTVAALRDGPLPSAVVEEIDRVWETVRRVAVIDPVNALLLSSSFS
ncbi:NADP-dependent oxidoreductase domain-containing protein [Aspergillus avenaceus]|uniref:NADP-dependent oxidoreductase domain-containing protein n=1 Tax=Aspergillus avenaceus TaxID=36643 RepID=A0A5N6U8K8_ASPAV|nr:NADP-dependent oxidoreductase domain-containing protein [Aspergillus avenaceus]